MKIRAGYRIAFQCEQMATVLLMLTTRWERHSDLLSPDMLTVEPFSPITQFGDLYGNLCSRVVIQPGGVLPNRAQAVAIRAWVSQYRLASR